MPEFEGDPASYQVEVLNAQGMTGSCLCKAVSITMIQRDLFARPNGRICHCLNCRRHTGSNAWSVLLLPSGNVQIADPRGHMRNYMDGETATGKPIPRSFCSNCGSTLGNIPEDVTADTTVAIAMGLFPRIPKLEFELFSAHKLDWLPAAVGHDKQYRFRDEVAGIF